MNVHNHYQYGISWMCRSLGYTTLTSYRQHHQNQANWSIPPSPSVMHFLSQYKSTKNSKSPHAFLHDTCLRTHTYSYAHTHIHVPRPRTRQSICVRNPSPTLRVSLLAWKLPLATSRLRDIIETKDDCERRNRTTEESTWRHDNPKSQGDGKEQWVKWQVWRLYS